MVDSVEYSEAEWKLIDHFGYRDYASNSWIMPDGVYKEMAMHAFVNNISGPAVDALRRVVVALRGSKIYRLTSEFDELVDFSN